MPTEFTPLTSLAGGVLIGISATLLMGYLGRIAGMTGVVSGIIPPLAKDWKWRLSFLLGAVLAPILYMISNQPIDFSVPVTIPSLVIGGFVVGLGAYFGSGCTSGHGVCGIARFSSRSIAATVTFMFTAFITVFIIRHVIGG